jgi:di/tricarboxylate transporter
MALAGGASAFLNNTPIVAMLVGPVTEWAERRGKSPSYFLMPLSFGVILGGLITTIGTSTNIVVSGLLENADQAPLSLFELTPVGLPVAFLGCAMIVILTPMVLPERRAPRQSLEGNVREFAVRMRVVQNGPLAGKPVEAGGLRHLQGVYLVQVERDAQRIAPVDPSFELQSGDVLTFVGNVGLVLDLQMQRGLESAERQHLDPFDTDRGTFFEVVVGAASPLVGRTLKEADFRSKYQAAVVAIHRSGHRIDAKLGEVELHLGDTLLLLADPGFVKRWRDRSDFLVVSRVGGTPPAATKKAWIAALVTVLIAFVAGAGLVPILEAALVGAILLVLLRVISPGEARAAVDLDVIILIGASFAIGAAIEKTGLAAMLASYLVSAFGWMGKSGALLGVLVATIALTEIITHAAAAVIMFPIAMSAADQAGAAGRPFAIAMCIGASASFLAPVGYQTNTMVYGPGGYRFGDYARLGAPLTVAVIVATMVIIPLVWTL